MTKIKLGMIVFFIFILSSTLFVHSSNNFMETSSSFDKPLFPTTNSSIPPKKFVGEEPIRDNLWYQGDFEEAEADGRPKGVSIAGSGPALLNASYTLDTHGGTYSGLLKAKGTTLFSAYNYLRPSLTQSNILITDNLNLDFWIKIKNPELINDSYVYFYLRFYDNVNSRNYYLYYYISYHSVMSYYQNTTTHGYFLINQTLNTWVHITRDITSDFNSVIAGASSNTQLSYFSFQIYAPSHSSDWLEIIVDDFVLSSDTYSALTENGDFELGDGSGWSGSTTGESHISLTDQHTHGNSAVNITSEALFDGSYSSTSIINYLNQGGNGLSCGWFASKPNETVVEFDWYLYYTENGGDNQEAYFSIDASNQTHYISLYIYLFTQKFDSYNNYTGPSHIDFCFKAENFGINQTWTHSRIDFYDYLAAANLTDISIYSYSFDVEAGNYANSTTTLLLDNVKFISYPTGDPGFEYQYYWSNNAGLLGWVLDTDHIHVNRTLEAHSGNWAANISAYSSDTAVSIYRHRVSMKFNSSLYTDFWYKINNFTWDVDSSVYFSVGVYNESNYVSINYVVSTSKTGYSNTSYSVYYILNNSDIGVWHNLVRNIYDDLQYFGNENSYWILDRITITVDTTGSGYVSTIFDDINFIRDTTKPTIQDIELLETPVYYKNVTIRISVTDTLSGIDTVTVFYRNDSTWYQILATEKGQYYEAYIPPGRYKTTYEYYVAVEDKDGNKAIDDSNGNYYTFFIHDDIIPTVQLLSPSNGSVLKDTVTLKVIAEDAGSSIKRIEIFIDTLNVGNITSAPYTFELDTRIVDNGEHILAVKAFDDSDNFATHSITILTENDFDGPTLSALQLGPDPPQANKPVKIFVSVTDDTGVSNVTLFYKIGDNNWNAATMSHNASLYYSEIPAVGYNVLVSYYVVAKDVYNQSSHIGSAEQPLTYTIKQSFSTIYSNYGILFGAAAVVILYGILKLIIWRVKKK